MKKQQKSTLAALSRSTSLKKKLKGLHLSRETLALLSGGSSLFGFDGAFSTTATACEPTANTGCV